MALKYLILCRKRIAGAILGIGSLRYCIWKYSVCRKILLWMLIEYSLRRKIQDNFQCRYISVLSLSRATWQYAVLIPHWSHLLISCWQIKSCISSAINLRLGTATRLSPNYSIALAILHAIITSWVSDQSRTYRMQNWWCLCRCVEKNHSRKLCRGRKAVCVTIDVAHYIILLAQFLRGS